MSYEDDLREHERECAREDEHWLDEQIEAAVEAERERCAKICDYRASLYPEGAAAKKEAQELGRRIRGQNG